MDAVKLETAKNQPGEAVEAGRRAVALDPEMAFAHYAHGHALLDDDTTGAESAAREALRLQPGADEYGLLAYVYSRQLRWKEALVAAEVGLEEDPGNECSRNFRALALTSLGRTTEAASAVQRSLATDPDDAYAHANRGWLLLRASNVEEALAGFRVALRLDPGMEWARLGVIEALKAWNLLYRLILRYTLWRSSAGTGTVSILVFVMAFVSNLAYGSYQRDPSLWPVVVPVGAARGLFIFGPWFLDPLSICGAVASSISIRASAMSWRRCRASFCSDRRIRRRIDAGVSEGSASQAGSRSRILASDSETVSPPNACRPASISKRTHPKLQMSLRLSTARPRACSGDMYAAVPRITPAWVAATLSVGEFAISLPPTPRTIGSPCRFDGLRQPEIENLDLAVRGDLDVRGLQSRDLLGKRFSRDQLHHQKRTAIVIVESMDGRDVRVIQRPEHARFAFETWRAARRRAPQRREGV